MTSPYLDHNPRSLSEIVRDRLLVDLRNHAPSEFVRVVWAGGKWAMLTVGEMIAELSEGRVADPEKIDRLEFLLTSH